MCQPRFGELLGRLVALSGHDINEILQEQIGTHRRFGDIALSWGLCQPEHVWQAWCDQLLTQVQKADLDKLGVDAQAAAMIDREVAHRLGIIPIRCLGQLLVVATSQTDTEHLLAELELITRMQLRFVRAEAHQIQTAIATYYAAGPKAA